MAYHAHCPALKGCHTWGYTYEEALANINEAAKCHIESLLKDNQPIPTGPKSPSTIQETHSLLRLSRDCAHHCCP